MVAWDVDSRKKRYRVHPFSHPSSCAIHPDETRIVVKNTAGTIALLDAQNGMLVSFLDPEKGNEGSNILYSFCGKYIVDGSWSGQFTVRSARSGKVILQKTFPNEMITKIACSTDGERWFVVHRPKVTSQDLPAAPAYISVWDWPLVAPADFLNCPEGGINSLSVAPDGRTICIVGDDSIWVMDLAEKRFVGSFPYNYGGTGFVTNWSPDSLEIATVQENSFVFYNAATLERLKTIELQYASDISYSPDGSLLALGAWASGLLLGRESESTG